MTPQERELITGFLQQMQQTQAGQKDAEAEALISQAVAGQPDAAYLLVQRAIGLDYALQSVRAELARAQAELQQARSGAASSFMDQGDSWGRSGKGVGATEVPPAPTAFTPAFSASPLAKPAATAPVAAAAPAGSWGSGMLGTVATTAAGVVAGSFLFQGIQGLMGHHGAGQGDMARAADTGAANIPPPALPQEQLAANEADLDAAAVDEGYFDSGDGGDSA
jgi:hypothetical protein